MQIDFLIAADAAQVVDGKLWMLGGAWDTIQVSRLPVAHTMAIAAGVLLSWEQAAVKHRFSMEMWDSTGDEVVGSSSGEFEQGQSSDLEPGSIQRFMFAISGTYTFQNAGEHVISLTVDGTHAKRISFGVVAPGG